MEIGKLKLLLFNMHVMSYNCEKFHFLAFLVLEIAGGGGGRVQNDPSLRIHVNAYVFQSYIYIFIFKKFEIFSNGAIAESFRENCS